MKAIKAVLGAIFLVVILSILDREIGYQQEGKVNSRRGSYVWAWVCILALAVLGLMNKCVNAQEPAPTAPKDTFFIQIWFAPIADSLDGTTICEGKNILILLRWQEDSLRVKEVKEHEMRHAEQIAHDLTCDNNRIRYVADKMTYELDAYCPSFRSAFLHEQDFDKKMQKRTNFVSFMFRKYGRPQKLDLGEVFRRVDECIAGRLNDPP